MRKIPEVSSAIVIAVTLAGCAKPAPQETNSGINSVGNTRKPLTLLQARAGFKTKLLRQEKGSEAVPMPPANLFQVVQYDSPLVGKLAAYVSQPPKDGKKHPAIIWIFGGFGNDIGATPWEPADPDNDQSASAFRKAGIVMMYPSLRGGNLNPGVQEGFFGEVNDVIAAVDYLAKQPFVDPKRIYLGGHSTGGTLALLVSESTDKFRAVFAFGAIDDVEGYGADSLVFDLSNRKELELRAPVRYLDAIKSPTFAFEGDMGGNSTSLETMKAKTTNPFFHGFIVENVSHFSILAPIMPLLAQKIGGDTGDACNITISPEELKRQIH